MPTNPSASDATALEQAVDHEMSLFEFSALTVADAQAIRRNAKWIVAALAASRERPTPEPQQENQNGIRELQGLPERPIPNLFDAMRDAGRKRAVCVHGDKKHDCLCAVCPDCIIAALRKPDARQPVVPPVPVEGLDEFFDLQDAPANDPRIAPKAIETICAMLGWMNVPPLRVLEAEIRAVKSLRARLAAVEGAKEKTDAR